ncbi:histidinol dehydrogenase, partial [Aliidiomarina sp. B3213]|uniref:histidinol dehydrogenase n=1 Tax=Aliidiomarina sp. B3213 TaxID=2249757 RepID=UPI001A9D383A
MITYLKRATPRPSEENSDLRDQVRIMLARIEAEGEEAVRDYARRLDHWQGEMILSEEDRRAACARLPQALQNDIRFAHDNIR